MWCVQVGTADFREGGSVKIKVWVNPEGQITKYEVLSAKNATIRAIAEQKIKGVRFNNKPDAAAEQSGILILIFKESKYTFDSDIDYKQKYFELLEDYKKLSDENRQLRENTD